MLKAVLISQASPERSQTSVKMSLKMIVIEPRPAIWIPDVPSQIDVSNLTDQSDSK